MGVKGKQHEGKSQVERDVITNKFSGSAERTRPAFPGLPAVIVRAEVLRVHRACKSDCILHVIIRFTYDFTGEVVEQTTITCGY